MSLSQIAQEHGLHRVGARPPLARYLSEVWKRRAFVVTMARYRLRSTFEQNRRGVVWVVLRPLIGANGSGTSTQIRAVTGLTPPASGAVYARSRPNLLGVGAALLPNLSGSRNIVLGGLAMGFTTTLRAHDRPKQTVVGMTASIIDHGMF